MRKVFHVVIRNEAEAEDFLKGLEHFATRTEHGFTDTVFETLIEDIKEAYSL